MSPSQTIDTERAGGVRRFRSVTSKFTGFTTALVFWVVLTILGYNLRQGSFDVYRVVVLCIIVGLTAAAISRFTIHILARPVHLLQRGIMQARDGKLEPIQVSRTADEIELLGRQLQFDDRGVA